MAAARRVLTTAKFIGAGLLTSLVVAVVGSMLYSFDRMRITVRGDAAVCTGTPFWRVTQQYLTAPPDKPEPDLAAPPRTERITGREPAEVADAFAYDLSAAAPSSSPIQPRMHSWAVYEAGWPAALLRGWSVSDRAPYPALTTHHRRWLAKLPLLRKPAAGKRDTIDLPLLPAPLGLALNTAAFAGAWWLLFAAPRATRSALRRRRGRCTSCGYDLSGLARFGAPKCPECGATVPTPNRVAISETGRFAETPTQTGTT